MFFYVLSLPPTSTYWYGLREEYVLSFFGGYSRSILLILFMYLVSSGASFLQPSQDRLVIFYNTTLLLTRLLSKFADVCGVGKDNSRLLTWYCGQDSAGCSFTFGL